MCLGLAARNGKYMGILPNVIVDSQFCYAEILMTLHKADFSPCDALLSQYMPSSCVCLSLCVCVCLSHSGIVSKRLNIGSRK